MSNKKIFKPENELPKVIVSTVEGGDFILRSLYSNKPFYDSLPQDKKTLKSKCAVILYGQPKSK